MDSPELRVGKSYDFGALPRSHARAALPLRRLRRRTVYDGWVGRAKRLGARNTSQWHLTGRRGPYDRFLLKLASPCDAGARPPLSQCVPYLSDPLYRRSFGQ